MIGNGGGRGIMQHTTLAVTEQGAMPGVADPFFFNRPEPEEGETRRCPASRPG